MTSSLNYLRPESWDALVTGSTTPRTYFAGGTDLVPLLRAGIVNPNALVDISGLVPAGIDVTAGGRIRIGAMARLADVAAHLAVRAEAPALSQALLAGASPQIRNAATIGGNILQRPRCGFFRDPAFVCNRRTPGSGCGARAAQSRHLAVFGGSTACAAIHPSDLAVALAVLDATVHLQSPSGSVRAVPAVDFHRLPEGQPEIETALDPDEVVVWIEVPLSSITRRSAFAKLRERASFDFATVSVAAAIDLEDGCIRQARIALGGVATRPWRVPEVEAALRGVHPDRDALRRELAGLDEGARPIAANSYKLPLLRELVARVLMDLMECKS